MQRQSQQRPHHDRLLAGRLVSQDALAFDVATGGTALGLLVAVVLGLAVQPVFTSACIAVAVALGDGAVDTALGCVSASVVVPVAVGMAVPLLLPRLLRRRRSST